MILGRGRRTVKAKTNLVNRRGEVDKDQKWVERGGGDEKLSRTGSRVTIFRLAP